MPATTTKQEVRARRRGNRGWTVRSRASRTPSFVEVLYFSGPSDSFRIFFCGIFLLLACVLFAPMREVLSFP